MTEIETYYFQALEYAKNKNDQFKHEELREHLKHIPDTEFKNLWTGLYLMNFIEGGSEWYNISQKGELELSRLQGQKETEDRFQILSANVINNKQDIDWNKRITLTLGILGFIFVVLEYCALTNQNKLIKEQTEDIKEYNKQSLQLSKQSLLYDSISQTKDKTDSIVKVLILNKTKP